MTDTDASTDPSRVKVRELDRRAVLRSAEIVALARDDQWDAPTPCGGWSLRRLLAHMAAQHLGFAAAAGADRSMRRSGRRRRSTIRAARTPIPSTGSSTRSPPTACWTVRSSCRGSTRR